MNKITTLLIVILLSTPLMAGRRVRPLPQPVRGTFVPVYEQLPTFLPGRVKFKVRYIFVPEGGSNVSNPINPPNSESTLPGTCRGGCQCNVEGK